MSKPVPRKDHGSLAETLTVLSSQLSNASKDLSQMVADLRESEHLDDAGGKKTMSTNDPKAGQQEVTDLGVRVDDGQHKVDDLGTRVEVLAGQVGSLTVSATALAENVSTVADSTRQSKRFARATGAVLTFLAVLTVLLVVILLQVNNSTQQLNDCLTPKGECAQRSAQTTLLVLGETSHRNEVERLISEIQVGQAAGNTAAVQVRTDRLNQERAILQQYDDAIKRVQAGDKNVPLPDEVQP